MFGFLIFVSIVSHGLCASIATDDDYDNLPILGIVGGTEAKIEDLPYQISFQYDDYHKCGGSILSPSVVISAAHCTEDRDPSRITIRAGTSQREIGGTAVPIKSYHNHPEYDPDTINYDLTIIILAKSFDFGPTIQPIQLPNQNEKLPVGAQATISGWGVLYEDGPSPRNLQKLTVPIWDQRECITSHKDVTPYMFCAGFSVGGKDTCQADSGGPLAYKNVLYGVVSWGEGCARPDQPGVYVHVAVLRNWIDQTILKNL